jgi:BirA family biotin operon repressor/biotin-[acetyl-CoA-carboxylase] ligase
MIQDLTPGAPGAGALALRALLEKGGEPWPAPLEHLAEVGSTSDRLKDRAREGAPELSVVAADVQRSGRGRQGRTWASPRGNLYVSVLLRPPARAAGLIPLAAGVAVCEALASFGVSARLKWPNDVLVGEKKIAGILAEASSGQASGAALAGAPMSVDWVVLGLGLNLDDGPGLPAEATSVRALTGRVVPTAAAAAAVLLRVRVWYRSLARGASAAVVDAWRERAVPWWGCLVEATAGERRVRGVAKDVDDEGALVLETETGGLERIVSGEISRVRLS